MNTYLAKYGILAAVSTLALSAASASAQTQAASAPTTDASSDIVVTARGRNEQLQNVPIAINAFSAQQITDAKIEAVNDFITLLPNVNITQSESAGLSSISIRGITQVRNGESPVAVVVDGVLQINSRQLTQSLFDLESIEVLRGPQGAMYGRNATGGAIIINTRRPTDDFRGYVGASYATGDEKAVEGSISGPIVPGKLRFRIGAKFIDRDGYFENTTLNRKQDPYRDITTRGLLSWTPTSDLTIDVNGAYSHTRASALNFHLEQAILNPNGTLAGVDFSIPPQPDIVSRTFVSNNIGRDQREIDEISLKASWNLDFATITSITGWSRIDEYTDGDAAPYSASLEGAQTQYTNAKGWSQELRLTSPATQRFRWMLGGYYLDIRRFISTTTQSDLGTGIAEVRRMPVAGRTQTFLADDNRNRDIAGFGNVAYDILPNVEAAFALRYDRETRRQEVSFLNTSGTPGAINHATFEKWQPKGTLSWKPSSGVNIYASYGVGFRSGQFNQNGTAALAAAAGIAGVGDRVPQENTTTGEIGFKVQALDRKLQINGSVFRTNVDNSQYFVFIGAVGAQVLVPINKVHLAGGELELTARPVRGLELNASVGYTDSKIEKYSVTPADVGNRAPYVPEVTVNLGAQYRTPITDSLGLFSRVDYRGLGKQYWDPENSAPRSYVNLVDLRLGVEGPKQRWSIIGSIENVFDKRYNAEFVDPGFTQPATPRIFRVNLRYNY